MTNASAPSRTEQEAVAGVDVGGTFTDVIVVGGEGRPRAAKVPTTPDDQADGLVAGIAEAHPGRPPRLVGHGTTTATNSILERSVARTVLVTTRGFRDLVAIGRQTRPSLYDLSVTRPEPIVPPEMVVTVEERVDAAGTVVVGLTDAEISRAVEEVTRLAPESIAISLLFSYANPDHERRLGEALAGRCDVPITLSSELLPEFREYERTSTCILNAAIAPVMGRYLGHLDERLEGSKVSVMTSGGGTASIGFAARAPVHTLLSGPAAGVVAAAAVARSAGFSDAAAFDMGGTSTDVCLIAGGEPGIFTTSEIAGLPFRTPAVGVHTVGAGGGSIAWMDPGGALRVGPASAGARPGPACYGLGGTAPTVTDAHAALGHLDAGHALGSGGLRLDVGAAERALALLPDAAEGAAGVLRVVRATMARALRRVTTEQGVSPATLALVAYGGAGPLHATALARELGFTAVIIPAAPGVLSALGLLLAPPRVEVSRTVMRTSHDPLDDAFEELASSAVAELRSQGVKGEITLTRLADCRYRGQSHELRLGAAGDVGEAFHAAHRASYGYDVPDQEVQVVTVRVVAQGVPALASLPRSWDHGADTGERRRRLVIDGEAMEARVIDRAALGPGTSVAGPMLIQQTDSTTLLGPADHALVDGHGNLVVDLG